MGLWHRKIPVEVVDQTSQSSGRSTAASSRVPGEQVLVKKRASAFHGTYLAGFLRANNVDTILVTGVTASACVRTTLCDGLAEGFRTIAVR